MIDNPTKKLEMFHCSIEIENYQCKSCPSFQTNFLTSLSAHIRGGHRDEASEQEPEFSDRTKSYDCKLRYNLFRCAQCPSEFTTKSSFDYHLISRHTNPEDIQWLKCGKCFADFKSKLDLNEHVRAHHPECKWVGFQCEKCPFRSTTKGNLKKHVLAHHTIGKLSHWNRCPHCPHLFKLKATLKKHVRNFHRVPENVQCFRCDQCTAVFTSKTYLGLHTKASHLKPQTSREFPCPQCSTLFKAKSSLRRHLKLSHVEPEKIKWFECAHCPYKCNDKRNLSKHVTYHDRPPESHFECEHCTCKFKAKATLKKHVKAYHNNPAEIRSFECPQCSYKFKDEANLENHIKYRHSKPEIRDDRCFECVQCSSSFKLKIDLKIHIKTFHLTSDPIEALARQPPARRPPKVYRLQLEDIKWFKCGDCPCRFQSMYALKEHAKTGHSEWSVGQQGSAQITDGKKSKRCIESQRPVQPRDVQFKCGLCSGRFKSVGALEEHSKTHVWHDCPHCPYKFRDGENLKKHVKYRHCNPV